MALSTLRIDEGEYTENLCVRWRLLAPPDPPGYGTVADPRALTDSPTRRKPITNFAVDSRGNHGK
jgi:hypothetical protein